MHNWNAVLDETTGHVSRLIQIDTTNPPGNEIGVARYLAAQLAAAGIEPRVLEPAANRAAIVARIRGTGAARPVLLLAHMDVVGVVPDKWTVDPFGGVIRDGYLYGRGAIDDKGMLGANLMVMLLLARELAGGAAPLARDVIFVATSDEEAGGEWGLRWLVANHPELVDAEYAVNEGGRTRIVNGVPLYVAVQVAEKVSNIVTVTARGPGGHAAIPLADNAIGTLARALARMAGYREPVTLLPAARAFFEALSAVWPQPLEAAAMRDLGSADSAASLRAAEQLARTPVFDAVLRNGISPTILHGGMQSNVIPTEAAATLSIRTLPGEQIDDVVRRLTEVAAEPAVELAIPARGVDTPPSDHRSPMFAAIRDTVRALAPTMATVPYLSTGATDSAILRSIGIQAYGLLPFPMAQEDEERMHGHDERVPIASLGFGVRLLHGAIARMCASVPTARP